MARRTFLAAVGGSAVGATALPSLATAALARDADAPPSMDVKRKTLTVQPVLAYALSQPREATSWRPWGGLHTESDVAEEKARIEAELRALKSAAEFSLEFRPLATAVTGDQAAALRDGDADVMLIYAASGNAIEALISPNRHNLVFVRHKSGPVYLWYEIAHPILLRKQVDAFGQPGLDVDDVVVDKQDDLLLRLRALYALKNTLGSRILAIGAPSGWGAGGQKAPTIAKDLWRLDMVTIPYEELGKRIQAARGDGARVKRAESLARTYLDEPKVKLKTDPGYVERAFLLNGVFEELMSEYDAPAMTVNECMTTIMPMTETTACLCLSLLNDAGHMAFCESDFVVIPSGILLHHIASMPVFLNDPTYPHDGQITLAHCTAPRRMNGRTNEKTTILTHFESDYGAAPKVDMKVGQTVTVIDPDFEGKKWIGFRGTIEDNPFLDICRSQVDIRIEGDWRRLVRDMVGFHWMMSYGDHLRELAYALKKVGVGWDNLSDPSSSVA